MKGIIKLLLATIICIITICCNDNKKQQFKPAEVYKSNDLVIVQIAQNSYLHTSFKQTEDFGNVPCNGLIVRNGDEAIVFDTPVTDVTAQELIKWVKDSIHCKINAIVPTHFHDDCLGGLKAFHENNIPSYAYFKSITLAKENNMTVPKNSFKDTLLLKINRENCIVTFFGEGHTKDNVVGFFQSDNILFGGCLIKEVNANKGYLGDANVADWSNTVSKIKKHYPNIKIVVPGHGAYGDAKLLDYTVNLFKPQ
ncbi:subclass B1 metallo-beta-lactamase [Flavobacterium sp. AS60]|uniref:subclass B1 metallo-beta-lactamase n=1 Tax=Flavobacterium anseongense TaxID=2910677 RepID=UPI001F286D2E|nr:subclass B1 metallo-beta-lactamase [Flavobacterium sp. AS60]MCF6129976.1 subclass B1 metallo-beta-lactamase [Flavobacterium sp. AS60]